MSELPIFTTRREFLRGSLTVLSAAGTLPVFLGRTALALADAPSTQPRRKADEHPILVVVQLAGGNDGLNTVIPFEDDAYYRNRRQLGIPPKDALRLAGGIGLHPAATGLKALYDAGQLSIVQGVGYPNPNRSHFVSMDVWATADPEARRHEGWLGRYFDATCKGDDPGPSPIEGVALTSETPLALQGERFMPLAFRSANELTWRAGRGDARAAATFAQLNNRDGVPDDKRPDTTHFLQRAALEAQIGAEEIRAAAGRGIGGTRGGELGPQLALVARLIRANLPTRVYYVMLSGFDTHSGQLGRQQRLLREFGEALEDFVMALRADKLLERVLVLSFSEFGRRVQENASGGTDHGEAAPLFIVGSRVRPGLCGAHPSLDALHRGDLAFHTDFRRVYADVLRGWLKLPARDVNAVLGQGFAPLGIVRG